MPKKILIMGLPGSGKTYFAEQLKKSLENFQETCKVLDDKFFAQKERLPINWNKISVDWFNADEVRKKFNDWDFSREGRIRQSLRMAQFSLECSGDFVICDFVAPLPEMRNNFKADWTIWLDTIESSRFKDTDQIFVPPDYYDFRITEKNAEYWVPFVADHMLQDKRRPTFEWRKSTVQMLGRWQPWHQGHRALFERLLGKTGQVCIMIRDCQGWNDSNPFDFDQVSNFIRRDLEPKYQGQFEILKVPNIVHIGYGRKVGYSIAEEIFDEEITKISGTEIRKKMGV